MNLFINDYGVNLQQEDWHAVLLSVGHLMDVQSLQFTQLHLDQNVDFVHFMAVLI